MRKIKFKPQDLHILIADDDPVSRAVIAHGLLAENYSVFQAEDGDRVLEICQVQPIDLAILDYSMQPNGIAIANLLRRLDEHPNFVFISAFHDPDIVQEAAAIGALNYLVKPVQVEQLQHAIMTACERARELNGLRRNLKHSGEFSVAVGLVAAKRGMSIPEAEEAVRQGARSQQIKLWRYAQAIIKQHEDDMCRLKGGGPLVAEADSRN